MPDPADAERMSYWCRKDTKTKRGPRPLFKPWPPGAAGLQLRGNVFPVGGRVVEIIEAIAADPVAAGQRFAEFTSRCCNCAKLLTDEKSKVYGIGPECRKGIPAEHLARYLTPQIGRAHATLLAEQLEIG